MKKQRTIFGITKDDVQAEGVEVGTEYEWEMPCGETVSLKVLRIFSVQQADDNPNRFDFDVQVAMSDADTDMLAQHQTSILEHQSER